MDTLLALRIVSTHFTDKLMLVMWNGSDDYLGLCGVV